MDRIASGRNEEEVEQAAGAATYKIDVPLTRDEMRALNGLAKLGNNDLVKCAQGTLKDHIDEQRMAGHISNPERLAYWYFRLNGFLTIENFLVHPEFGSNPRTDVDILASRFKCREENHLFPMKDDVQITECETFTNVIIAEIKTGLCRINGPWTNPDKENMERVLRAIGCAEEKEVPLGARSLYETGRWANDNATIRLFAIGEQKNDGLVIGRDQQVEWASVIDFCVERFKEYQEQKKSNGQWSKDGIRFREFALDGDIKSIRSYFCLDLPGEES